MERSEFVERADAIFARLRDEAPELWSEPIARVPFTEAGARAGAADAIGAP